MAGLANIQFFIIPFIIILAIFVYSRTKKRSEFDENSRFGRRGKKDHIWQIIKEYHKKKGEQGVAIEISFIFDRPQPAELYEFLKKASIYRAKFEAKEKGVKYVKPKFPKRFEEQDYFDQLTVETSRLNSTEDISSKRIESLRKQMKNSNKRRRYVIVYKLRKQKEVTEWKSIEVEMIKKPTKEGKDKDVVVVNKELDFVKELSWLQPLLEKKLEDQKKKEEADRRRKEQMKSNKDNKKSY